MTVLLSKKTLDKFIIWCNTFNLSLNISKCKVMTFHRSKSMMFFDYRLGGISIQRVSQVHDLGILFVPSLNFGPHIDYMTTNAFRVMGFIRYHSFTHSISVQSIAFWLSIMQIPYTIYHIPPLILVGLTVFKIVLCFSLVIASIFHIYHMIMGQ